MMRRVRGHAGGSPRAARLTTSDNDDDDGRVDPADAMEPAAARRLVHKRIMPEAARPGTDLLPSSDPAVIRVLALATRVAQSGAAALILGEPGTGKSLLARRIHALGPRAGAPFVEIPCANLPADLVESELFGHERGAFTGAHARRIGRFEAANGGTVLLDGVADLPAALQGKLLRVLQEKVFERLGGGETIRVDVRILSSAPPEIEEMVRRGEFREDLFYRINVVSLRMPPLRERRDLPALAERLIKEAADRFGSPARRFSAEALELFGRYDWPGNIRELRNACEVAALRSAGEEATPADLPLDTMRTIPGLIARAAATGLSLAQLQAVYIREVLARCGNNRSAAARILGISRKTLLEKRRRYGIP